MKMKVEYSTAVHAKNTKKYKNISYNFTFQIQFLLLKKSFIYIRLDLFFRIT